MLRQLRHANATAHFPYTAETVPFILLAPEPKFAKTVAEKLELLEMAETQNIRVLATWPGKWSQDVFEVNDRLLARRALEGG